jgi:hypothetical protein
MTNSEVVFDKMMHFSYTPIFSVALTIASFTFIAFIVGNIIN